MKDKIPGQTITLRGRELVIPPLTAAHLEDHEDAVKRIFALGDMKTPVPVGEDLSAIVTLVHAALCENYPNLSRDDVRRLVDAGNLLGLVSALMGVAGFDRATKGEDAPKS